VVGIQDAAKRPQQAVGEQDPPYPVARTPRSYQCANQGEGEEGQETQHPSDGAERAPLARGIHRLCEHVQNDGGSGIGQAASLAFSREGARVVVASRGTQAGEERVRAIGAAGGEAV